VSTSLSLRNALLGKRKTIEINEQGGGWMPEMVYGDITRAFNSSGD
jgi:hypothetical protein